MDKETQENFFGLIWTLTGGILLVTCSDNVREKIRSVLDRSQKIELEEEREAWEKLYRHMTPEEQEKFRKLVREKKFEELLEQLNRISGE